MNNAQFELQCERCIPQETCIHCVQLATAYVPFQKFCGVWSPCRSLTTGTAFPELFSPYHKREYVNLEPEATCPEGGRHGCRPCGQQERRLCYG
ncbi:MAG: spore coat associated protein CotJA [Christensenellaceae bacterium]|nr:spore coat associated protein CotJA [Eubacteriales bacterium]MEA5069828.1 spore coat associated protein CotJA [Christensenellaceae bacterium]